MSEFEDREKHLGELTEDISIERGDLPFPKKELYSPPPRLLKRDPWEQDQEVTSVFDARPLNARDWIHTEIVRWSVV